VKGEPEWVSVEDVLLFHEALIAGSGGSGGLRDRALLESALARPKHAFTYDAGADLFAFAGAYVHGLAKNHPFLDGNSGSPSSSPAFSSA